MSYCWQIHTLASKALVPIPQSHGSICVGLSQSQRVPCSPWWRHPHNTTSINNYPSVRCDDEGISKIRVPDRNTSLFPRRHHPLYTRWYWCQFTPTTSVQFQWQGGRKPLWLSACFGPHRSFTISRHTYHFLVCPTPNTHTHHYHFLGLKRCFPWLVIPNLLAELPLLPVSNVLSCSFFQMHNLKNYQLGTWC